SPQAADLQFTAAEADFQKALSLGPNEEAAYALIVNRGVVRLRQHRFAEAVADFQSAVQMKPNQLPAYVNLAKAYQGQKELEEAAGGGGGAARPGHSAPATLCLALSRARQAPPATVRFRRRAARF